MQGRFAVSAVAAVAASLALADAARATDFPVTTNADGGAGSLRAAVASANGNAGPDSVSFSGVTGTITLTTGQISITGPVEISGPGPEVLAISGNEASRIFGINGVAADPGVEISGLRLTGGQPGDCGCGGAIGNFQSLLVLDNTVLDHNDATWGGAIESYQAELEVTASTFNNNTSSHEFGGGAIHSDAGDARIADSTILDNSAQGSGGGMALYGGKYTVEGSTVSGNHSDADGGGIVASGKLKVTNSTIAGNDVGGYGGGVGNYAKMKVKSSTIAGNEAARGGGIAGDGPKQAVQNSIVADNTATIKAADLLGVYKASYSLVESKKGSKLKGKHNIFKQDPLLGPLGPNGGPTETMPLDSGSPARNKASKKSSPDLDQRGEERDRKPDMGAFELVPL